jgi:hypothetical protein
MPLLLLTDQAFQLSCAQRRANANNRTSSLKIACRARCGIFALSSAMVRIRAMSNGTGYAKKHLEKNDCYAEGEKVIGGVVWSRG